MEKGTEGSMQDNPYGKYFENLELHLGKIGNFLQEIKSAQESKRVKDSKVVHAGSDILVNFDCQSIFVDNSQNPNVLTINPFGKSYGFSVAANSTAWVHPLGGKQFSIGGIGSAVCMFINEFVPITETIKGGAGSSSNVSIFDSAGGQLIGSMPGDAISPIANPLEVSNFPHAFNGSTWDRFRNITPILVAASAARTTSLSFSNITNYNSKGLKINLNVTSASGTGGLTIHLTEVDPFSGNVVNIWNATAAVTAIGRYEYEIYPGSTSAPQVGMNVTERISATIGKTFFLGMNAGDSTSYSYSLGVTLLN